MSMNDSVLLTLAGRDRLQVEKVCEITGLSMPALQNCVNQLNAIGANIDLTSTYINWREPFECLSAASIETGIGFKECEVCVLDSTTSTNAVLAAEESVHGRVFLAEHQSGGVGRRGKPWLSPLGKNLYISCGWEMPSTQLSGALSLVIGISIARALREFGCDDVGLKWPNDLYIRGEKVGGLLIDSVSSGPDAQLIVGLGVNVFSQDFPESLDVPATTLAQQYPALKKQLNRNHLAGLIVDAIFQELTVTSNGKSEALSYWSDYDVSYNQRVKVLKGDEVITGVAKGITADGEFILSAGDGIVTFAQAEVSLRM